MTIHAGAFGIGFNGSSKTPFDQSLVIARQLKLKSLRVWMSINDWSNPQKSISADSIRHCKAVKAAGFHLLVCLTPEDGVVPANDAQVKAQIDYLMGGAGLKGVVDIWEVGNEMSGKNYWQGGSIESYVNKLLKPAAQALHAYGEKVCSEGPSWDVNEIQKIKDAGGLDVVDYVGYHMYIHDEGKPIAQTCQDRFNSIRKMTDKPICITEWTVRGYAVSDGAGGYKVSDANTWAQKNAEVLPVIAANAEYAYFFAMFVSNQMAGCFSVLKPDGTKNEPSYSAYIGQYDKVFNMANQPTDPTTPTQPTVKGASATGFVRDDRGQGLAGMTVYFDADNSYSQDKSENVTTTAQDGSFKLDGLTGTDASRLRVIIPDGYQQSNPAKRYGYQLKLGDGVKNEDKQFTIYQNWMASYAQLKQDVVDLLSDINGNLKLFKARYRIS